MTMRNRAFLAGAVLLAACSEPVIPDYNNSTEDQFAVIRTEAQLQQLATGVLDVDRRTHDFQILLDETIARDVFRHDAAETRYITQPLGSGSMSPTVFVGQSVFNGPYRAIRSAQNLISAAEAASDELTGGVEFGAEKKSAVRGYAQTIKALSYMRLVEQRDTLGTAIYTTPTELNPIQCKENVLELISALLDSAKTDLLAGGDDFGFALPSGFDGFDTPETFLQFNRALKAKNEYYRAFDLFARTGGANPGPSSARTIDAAAIAAAEAALAESFFDETGDPNEGVYHTYSSASGDYLNPNYDQTKYRINPRVVREAEGTTFTVTGTDTVYTVLDRRVQDKVDLNYVPADCKVVSSTYSCFIDKVNSTDQHPLPIIRNDELALIKAQLLWGRGQYQQALDIVNRFRLAAGFAVPKTLAEFGGADTPAEQLDLMREILKQKRYQLLFESPSRFVDFRMFGIMNDFGKERSNDPIPVFPFPSAETLARGGVTDQVCD